MRDNKAIFIACGICILSLIAMLVVIIATQNAGRFVPPKFDGTAVVGMPSVPEAMGYTPVDVEDGYRAFVCGQLKAVDGVVDVYFTSPADNAVWMKLRVMDKDSNTLGETGVIKPGEYVKSMRLNDVESGTMAVKLKIIAYQPDTWISMGTVGLNTDLIVD